MKKSEDKLTYYFADESGDTVFYNRYGRLVVGEEGISKILVLGFISTENPQLIRKKILKLKNDILNDSYLKDVPSIKKTAIAFHAKDDCPEVREKVYKTILKLDFTSEIFVARKIPSNFIKRHHRNENEFYDDLVGKLFENKLHLAKINKIYFAVRGNKTRQIPLEKAIDNAKIKFEKKWNKKIESSVIVQPQSPSGEPCIQVIDYVIWAVQRAFVKKEMRFFNFIEEKVKYLVDVYDTDKYPKNFYSKKNKFDITKISPL
jgi:hypothetical protein